MHFTKANMIYMNIKENLLYWEEHEISNLQLLSLVLQLMNQQQQNHHKTPN